MIRMVLLLMLGIGATMVIYGNDAGLPQGSDAGTLASNTPESNGPGILTRVGTLIEGAAPSQEQGERVPLKDEQRAIEIALAATVPADEPADAPVRRVQIGNSDADTPEADTPEQEGLWYVTGTTVNLRGGPSTSDAVVGRVRLGQRAEVVEETADGWYRIRTADDGQDGYIFGKFLSPNRPG
ncbi:SH3 domain-containing protein [Oceaniglobus trochenteri]|uniref:SH3 domain-containing protein n=1 Tax=Oceaniglobus trochenteri TaxID=2763260 RepID=UPI001CFF7810|nr:SH3 domain-containing protein [Oceaniglobus trochenteri]